MSKNRFSRHVPLVQAVTVSVTLVSGCTQIAGESFDGYSLRPDMVPNGGKSGVAGEVMSGSAGEVMSGAAGEVMSGAAGEVMSGAAGGGMSGAADGAASATNGDAMSAYAVEERQLMSGGIERGFILAHPEPMPDAPLPLVLSFHGERDTEEDSAESIRTALPLEREAAGAAVFVYPRAPNSAPGWPFFNDAGRTIEAKFITAVIVALEAELNIDPKRVFLAGWDGGAVMVNALACRLGTNVLRGVAAHSGSLYEVPRDDGMGNDFEFDLDTGVTSCPLPDALLIWGKADQSGGTTYAADGTKTRNWYRATLGCQPSTQPWTSSPACVRDTTCPRSFVWCPIEGLGHSIWPGAAAAIWRFFDGLR